MHMVAARLLGILQKMGAHTNRLSLELSSQHSRIRSQFVYKSKQLIESLYQLDSRDPARVRSKVQWLLEKDRFLCLPRSRDVSAPLSIFETILTKLKRAVGRFLAPEIISLVFEQFFKGKKMRGRRDKSYFDKINHNFIALTAGILYHTLRAWITGAYVEPPDYRGGNSRGMPENT